MNTLKLARKWWLFSLGSTLMIAAIPAAQAKTFKVTNDSELAQANNAAVAGDIVELAGGRYGVSIAPANSGKVSAPIIYTNRAGEVAHIKSGTNYELNISGRDYIEVRGNDVGGGKGVVLGGTSPTSLGGNLRILACTGCVIDGVRHQFSLVSKPGLSILGSSGSYAQDIVIANSEFFFHTQQWNNGIKSMRDSGNDDQKWKRPQDSGNGLWDSESGDTKYVRRLLFKGNTFELYGGHSPIGLHGGDRIIFQGNTMDNDWSRYVDGESDKTNKYGLLGSCLFKSGSSCSRTGDSRKQNREGTRAFEFKTKYQTGDSRLMFQDNLVRKTGYGPDTEVTASKLMWRGLIYRNNIHYNERSQGVGIVSLTQNEGSLAHDVRHQFFYNNSFVMLANAGLAFNVNPATVDKANIDDVHYLNNLHYKIGYEGIESSPYESKASLSFLGRGAVHSVFKLDARGNLFDSDASFVVNEGGAQTFSLGDMENRYSGYFKKNARGTAKFANHSAVANLNSTQRNDFKLSAGSDGIDIGAHLTQTRGAGSGNQVSVEHAGFFFDGWGIKDENGQRLPGDTIKIEAPDGSLQRAVVVRVQYGNFGNAAGTLVLDRVVDYKAGSRIWSDFAGSAPDAGAFEFGGAAVDPSAPPAAPKSINIKLY